MIISDKVGTEYFKIYLKKKLFFSYDFRDGVDTDLQIILRSKYISLIKVEVEFLYITLYKCSLFNPY